MLLDERRKLLTLHYAGQISAELFGEQEALLTARIDALRHAEQTLADETVQADDVRARFDEIAAYLGDLDIDAIWEAATEPERRVLIDELLQSVDVHEDHLEVTVHGAPKLNVLLEEVGLGKPGEEQLCRRGDSNPHTLSGTSPSS